VGLVATERQKPPKLEIRIMGLAPIQIPKTPKIKDFDPLERGKV
jgi:hypothetical protein